MDFRGWILLALLGLAIGQKDDPNLVDGKDNVVVGDGGNVISGSGNYVNGVDPTIVSEDLKKLSSEPNYSDKFVVGAPLSVADRTTALRDLMKTVMKDDYPGIPPAKEEGNAGSVLPPSPSVVDPVPIA